MAFDSSNLDDYIDVAQRIVDFRAKYPEGSLQPVNPGQPFEVREMAGTAKDGHEVKATFIVYTAAAYRTPDDQRPGIGCAYEVFPGRTPYTAGSELQNAETAAWGRAIVAALAADSKAGIASKQEVRNRQAERESAGSAFENAAPAAPASQRQNQDQPSGQQGLRSVPPEVRQSDPEWLAAIGEQIEEISTREEGTKAWADVVQAHKTGKCAADDRRVLEQRITGKLSAVIHPSTESEAS